MLKTMSNMMATPQTKDSMVSTGRGGAGNLGPSSPQLKPTLASLRTPTIKKETYTTGRGGAGNMLRNLPEVPEMARAAQDVEGGSAAKRRESMHSGRGGAGNFHKSPRVKPALTKQNSSTGSTSGGNGNANTSGGGVVGDNASVRSDASSAVMLDDEDVSPPPTLNKAKARAGSRSSQLSEKAGAVFGRFKSRERSS